MYIHRTKIHSILRNFTISMSCLRRQETPEFLAKPSAFKSEKVNSGPLPSISRAAVKAIS